MSRPVRRPKPVAMASRASARLRLQRRRMEKIGYGPDLIAHLVERRLNIGHHGLSRCVRPKSLELNKEEAQRDELLRRQIVKVAADPLPFDRLRL